MLLVSYPALYTQATFPSVHGLGMSLVTYSYWYVAFLISRTSTQYNEGTILSTIMYNVNNIGMWERASTKVFLSYNRRIKTRKKPGQN